MRGDDLHCSCCCERLEQSAGRVWDPGPVEAVTADPGLSRRAFLKAGTGAAGLVTLGAGLSPTPVHAEDPFGIITTREWGARAPRSAVQLLNRRPTYVLVHHTAGANTTNYSRTQAINLARGIQNFHMNPEPQGRGWIDSGQQLTISRGGFLLEGRHRSLEAIYSRTLHCLGTHVADHNSEAVGIENEGTYTSAYPTGAQYGSLIYMLYIYCYMYRLNPYSAIRGHRDFNATQCPGNFLYALLRNLQDWTQYLLSLGAPGGGGGGKQSHLTVRPFPVKPGAQPPQV